MSGEHASDENERFDHVSILEYNEHAADYDREPGKRVVVAGVQRDQHVHDDETGEFVKVAEAVAIIEVYRQLTDDEVTAWCNTAAGKLALAHWFDHVEPNEVVMA